MKDGVNVIPLNGLSQLSAPRSTYVVVGAGKTGIDACLWLLQQRVAPDQIYWVMPRDSWYFKRDRLHPGDLDMLRDFFLSCIASSEADSTVHDFHCRLERDGTFFRLDPQVIPLKNKCVTVAEEELQALRRIKNIVCMGHVTRLEKGCMVMQRGRVAMPDDTLYADCSRNGLARMPHTPVFSECITL